MQRLDTSRKDLLEAAVRYLARVAEDTPEDRRIYQVAATKPRPGEPIAVLPRYCRYRDASPAIDVDTGEVVDWLLLARAPGFSGRTTRQRKSVQP